MKILNKILKHLDELIKQANFAPSIYQINFGQMDDKHLDHARFVEWNTRCLNLLKRIQKGHSVHLEKFLDEENKGYRKHEKEGKKGRQYHSITIEVFYKIAILKALKIDIEKGAFFDEELLITADAFDTVLEQAEYLLKEDYKDAAATLVGAVLESTLRKLCEKHNLSYQQHTNIHILNDMLLKDRVYNKFVNKQIIAWSDIRNNAAHGNFTKYAKKQVEDMLRWVKDFIGKEFE